MTISVKLMSRAFRRSQCAVLLAATALSSTALNPSAAHSASAEPVSLQRTGGEGGIRTPGTGFSPVQQISKAVEDESDPTLLDLNPS